jgi:ABC-type ATPase with predicted acetyltransferase domain
MVNKVAIWKCGKCGDVVMSKSWETHTLDKCFCNSISIDFEEYYCRIIGDNPSFYKVIEIKQKKQKKNNKKEDK